MPGNNKNKFQELRKKAEIIASKKTADRNPELTADMFKLLHELEVHQVELELQNENLQITQLELENARERYFDLYDLAPIGYCTISEKGLILEANLSVAALLGVPRNSLTGETISKFILKEDQDIFYLHRKQLLKTGKPQSFELRMKKKDGTSFWVYLEAVAVLPLNRPNKKDADPMAFFRVMLSDITIPKKAEEVLKRDKETLEKLVEERSKELIDIQKELEKSKRLKDIGVLAATVAHELRNPLFGIELATSVIKKKTSDKMILHQLQRIEKMIAESGQIIDNLLFYSKLRMPDCKTLNLHFLIEECIDSIQARRTEKNISISKHIDSLKNVPFSADPGQLKEVFSNILNNALDAVPDTEGKIDVKARVYREKLKIYINDNGSGISKEDKKEVFEPFFTTKSQGTGLGLTVCEQIVKMHGGFINIKRGKEKGVSFIITLPIDCVSPKEQ